MTRKYRVQCYCLISAGLICLSAFYCHPKWTNRIINSGPITEMARARIYPGKHHYVYPQINRHHKVPLGIRHILPWVTFSFLLTGLIPRLLFFWELWVNLAAWWFNIQKYGWHLHSLNGTYVDPRIKYGWWHIPLLVPRIVALPGFPWLTILGKPFFED